MGRFRDLVLLCLIVAGAARGEEEKVLLKAAFRKGDTYDVKERSFMRLTDTVDGERRSVADEGIAEYREKVLQVEDGIAVKAERVYRRLEQRSEERIGDLPPETDVEKNPIVGETLTLIEEDDTVRLAKKPKTGTLEEDELAIGEGLDAYLPSGPVSAGEHWEVVCDEGGNKVRCMLERLEETGSSRIAVIRVRITVVQEDDEGATITTELEGPLRFDVAKGRPLSLSLKGEAKAHDGATVITTEEECTLSWAK